MSGKNFRLGFRADIEGLRAVAIILVVAAHARVKGLAGGFVGVDVFFVLSGYLISGLLLQQIAHGPLDFMDFYARRLRRLLPGLVLMLLVSSLLGWLLVAPDQQAEQGRGAAGAALWLSNFVFASGDLDYFGPHADTNLFLHTWSLAVEEQFYLAWPLLLVLASGRYAHATGKLDSRRLKLILSGVLAISLMLCVTWTRTHPLPAFYLMPTRAWQFALGGLTFMLTSARAVDAARRSGILREAQAWLGLAAILFASCRLNGNQAYPGLWVLLPSLGTAAILSAGIGTRLAAVLSLRPMQAIGRVSYAWYLWHWPVLLLGATIFVMDAFHRAALVALSLVLASLSYFFVEAPIRRNAWLLVRPALAIGAALVASAFVGGMNLYWQHAARTRMAIPEMNRYEQVRDDKPVLYALKCDDWYFSAEAKLCSFGPSDAMHTAVALGDSIGLQWFPAYVDIFTRPGWRLLVGTKSSCPMVDAPFFYARIGREYSECAQWRTQLLRMVATLKPDVVVMGSSHASGFTASQWADGTARVLSVLSPASGHVYVMRSTPILPFDGPSCLEPRSALYDAISSHRECHASAADARSEEVYQALVEGVSAFANASIVDMNDVVCPGQVCSAERNGVIVFRDTEHLSASYARSLAGALRARLEHDAKLPAVSN